MVAVGNKFTQDFVENFQIVLISIEMAVILITGVEINRFIMLMVASWRMHRCS